MDILGRALAVARCSHDQYRSGSLGPPPDADQTAGDSTDCKNKEHSTAERTLLHAPHDDCRVGVHCHAPTGTCLPRCTHALYGVQAAVHVFRSGTSVIRRAKLFKGSGFRVPQAPSWSREHDSHKGKMQYNTKYTPQKGFTFPTHPPHRITTD